jgi:hypothetical protein
MLKILAALVLLVVAVSVLGLASEIGERAYASPVVLADTVTAVGLPATDSVVDSFRESTADDGFGYLPGDVESVLVSAPRPVEQTR